MTAVAGRHAYGVIGPNSVERALRAEGVLEAFNRAGVLASADVHVALRLQRLCGENDERVLLAAALAVRAVRHGSVVVELSDVATRTPTEDDADVADLTWPDPESWREAIEASPLVSVSTDGPDDRSLRWVDGLLYLDRYWRQERVVSSYVDAARLALPLAPDVDRLDTALRRLLPSEQSDRQRLAAYVAAHRRFSIVAGGPGTGKTTTVARLLAVLQDLAGGGLRVALAAPTGKAAARMTETAAAEVARFSEADRERVGILTATTLHRLLGSRRGERTRFWYDRDNRLPYDVVVVDEASMVSLTLMSRLIEALRRDCRLILVGDPDQLSSIEVGAVLGDLVARAAAVGVAATSRDEEVAAEEGANALVAGVVRLTEVHRYAGHIHELAEAIRRNRPDEVVALLRAGHDDVEYVDADPADPGLRPTDLRADVVDAGREMIGAARDGDGDGALKALGRHRVLCAHREGPYGVAHWSKRVQEWLSDAVDGYAADGLWYVGRPLLVASNDYQLRLFNGDTGVIVNRDDQPRAAFRRDGQLDLLAPSRLGDVQTVHAMSIHRSQGSQFERVSVVLPPAESPLLTRELLYTAVTRAEKVVRIVGAESAVRAAVERQIVRASGLRSVVRS